MRLAPRLVLAALAGTLGLTTLAAPPAVARTSVSIQYRDRDHRDYRDHRDHRDRDWRGYRNHDRWDRHDRRYGWRGDARRCWTEWRYDYRHHQRYAVRYCR